MLRKILICLLTLCLSFSLKAQHVSLSTNLLDWAALGTVNLSAAVSVDRHFSIELGGCCNPFQFTKSSGLLVMNKQLTGYAAVKYWPWYVFSGWWISAKAQYSDYSRTGIWRYAIDEGRKLGGGLSFGYTLMISKRLNIDFGAGIWGGKNFDHTLYHCSDCMKIRESGSELFLSPDKISVSLMYVF